MNILVVCHYGLYQDFGSSFVHNQVKAFVAAGHRVRVIIPLPVGKIFQGNRLGPALITKQADGVDIFYVRFLSASNYGEKYFNAKSVVWAVSGQLRKILKDWSADVIHAHTLGLDSCLGAWLKKKMRRPLVVTTHGSDTEKPLKNGELGRLKAMCDQADRVVAVSRCLQQRLLSCHPETPVCTILNGFVPNKAEADARKAPFSIVQVGHLIPSKRNAVTIQALAQLREEYPQMKLTVIGAGYLRQQLEELVTELRLTEAVTFTGEIPNPQVLAAMAKATYFIMPSKPEGFGIVYLEAMYNRCITIGTEGEGISELIVSGENGFLVPADNPEAIVDAVRWCQANPEAAAAIGEQGRRDTEALTWKQNAQRYTDLFRELIGEK